MLNELYSLEQGLAASGVEAVARHPDLSALLKGDVVRVRLDARGSIAEVELLPAKQRPEIWTLRDGKHNGFPGLKTAAGLLGLSTSDRSEHDERWKRARDAAAKRLEIERLVQSSPIDGSASQWPKPGHRARIAERLAELRPMEDDPATAAVPAAFERFLAATTLTPGFLERVLGALLERVKTGDEFWLDPVRKALVEAMPLAIDVAREPQFPRDAGDERQIAAVSSTLQGVPKTEKMTGDLFCALSGPSTNLLRGNFPQPTLPSLGISFLFSRNRDIPAMGRYGRIGSESLAIDADLAGRLSGALTTVTAESRRGKTWRLLPAETGEKQDLLIAYVATDLDAPVATALDDDIEETVSGEAELEATGTSVLRLFKGLETVEPDAKVRFLLLRAVDPANRKAVFDRQSTVGHVYRAALAWTGAMSNAPTWLRWPIFVANKLVRSGPRPREPLSLTALSRRFYIRGGRQATDAPGVSTSEALALFLDGGQRPARSRRVLLHLLGRHETLLAGLAHANCRSELPTFDPKGTARRDGLRSMAWMSALLFFLGRPKEVYMEETGFKLGQLLSAMDAVHMGYCADVRGGQIPPTLIGNSVFGTAGRHPVRALDVLSARWKPYGAWARREDHVRERMKKITSESLIWTIRRGLSQARIAQKLCDELHRKLDGFKGVPPEQFRAELLLGYVAGVRPEPKPDDSEHDTASADGGDK